MHISEGVLSLPVLAGGWVLAGSALAFSLHKTEASQLPKAAVFGSAFFLASLIKVPIGASSAHFALLGFMGLTLGYAAVPAIFIALFLQALLYQFGGLISLGVNTVIMSFPALASYLLFKNRCKRYLLLNNTQQVTSLQSTTLQSITFSKKWLRPSFWAFVAGFMGIALGASLVVLCLWLSNEMLLKMAWLFILSNLPLAFCEGLVTMLAVSFLAKTAPKLLLN